MHHGVDFLFFEQFWDQRAVANVTVDEAVVRAFLDAGQVFRIAGIGERVQIDDAIFRMMLAPVMNEVGADEAGAAGDEYGFHVNLLCLFP